MNPGLATTEELRALLGSAADAAAEYTLATGVDCALLDETGGLIFDASPRRGPSCPGGITRENPDGIREPAGDGGICLCLRVFHRRYRDCRDLHLYAASQAERFGGSYIYLCPIGMHYWASPVYAGDSMVGILVGGPVRAIDAEEAFLELLERQDGELGEELIRGCVASIPAAEPERIHALAALLSAVSQRISPAIALSLNERQRFLDQQAHIAAAIHEMKFSNPGGGPVPAYPIAKERELLDAIRKNDEAKARRVLNELLGAVFFTSAHRFDLVKFRGLELMVLLSRAAAEAGASVEEVLGLNYRFLKRFQELENQEDLAFLLDGVLSRFSRLAFSLRSVKHTAALDRAVRFVKRRLTTSVSLQDAASAAGLSPSYFSRIFKEEMYESFSEYISRLRVEKAASLLLGTQLPLVDIATRVGFVDQSYFTKVFKRLKGSSPGRYRATGGRPREINPEIHDGD